jgi:hypothetical protein
LLVNYYLLASYCYYLLDESPLTDDAFDYLCKRLLDVFDQVEHQHKHLITKADLEAGTCLLREDQFPLIVRTRPDRFMHRVNDGSLIKELLERYSPKDVQLN